MNTPRFQYLQAAISIVSGVLLVVYKLLYTCTVANLIKTFTKNQVRGMIYLLMQIEEIP